MKVLIKYVVILILLGNYCSCKVNKIFVRKVDISSMKMDIGGVMGALQTSDYLFLFDYNDFLAFKNERGFVSSDTLIYIDKIQKSVMTICSSLDFRCNNEAEKFILLNLGSSKNDMMIYWKSGEKYLESIYIERYKENMKKGFKIYELVKNGHNKEVILKRIIGTT